MGPENIMERTNLSCSPDNAADHSFVSDLRCFATSDVDLENPRLSDANNSGSSSTSSLSGGRSDSPSTSSEFVAPGHPSSSSLPGRSSETPETNVGHSSTNDSYKITQNWDGDSDIEVEQDAPDWTKNVPEEVLSQMTHREKKRQEILNELLHTERSHVRNLKVMDRLFHKPLRNLQYLPQELILMLFANLEEILEIHSQFNSSLKKKRREAPLVGNIGGVILEIFEGDTAESFRKAAANCCSRQQIGLKYLKERREKSPKLNAFLQEAEQDPVCRRLQLQDMIPMAMQRLTKYPLIFENLCHCTPSDTDEYKNLLRAVEMSKEILNSVNQAKKEAEDYQRLVEIQRRVDKSSLEKGISSLEKGLDKSDLSIINELRNLDITKHKLIYEGPLLWRSRSNKQKSEALQEVQLVLLHDMVVLLLKQDDRFVLKIHVSPSYPGKSAERVMSRPVIKLNNLIHRANAADKRAFLLVNMTSTNMYELVCATTEERKLWLQHITKAAEDYKNRQQESRRPDNPNSSIPVETDEKSKDSRELEEGAETERDIQESGFQKESIPVTPSSSKDSQSSSHLSPGDTMLSVGNEKSRSVSASPKPERKLGEFLRITETTPLVDPTEVVVVTRDVQFAQPVLSKYEELKRLDSDISKAFDDKLKLISSIHHIPGIQDVDLSEESASEIQTSKDAKEIVVVCLNKVDQLGQLLSGHKVTSDNMQTLRREANIHQSLSSLLTQLLSEIHRKDEQEEIRRQELQRIREQNHGYQERLMMKKCKDIQTSRVTTESSPTLSPAQSRPQCFISSSDQRDGEQENVTRIPSKSRSCDHVPSCSSNSSQTFHPDVCTVSTSSETLKDERQFETACDFVQEEFADAVEELDESSSRESCAKPVAKEISVTPCKIDTHKIEFTNSAEPSKSTNGHDHPPEGSEIDCSPEVVPLKTEENNADEGIIERKQGASD